MAKGYCTKEDVEKYVQKSLDIFGNQVDKWIEAMENYIDRFTHRSFLADENFSIKRYDGNGEQAIGIDDAVEIDELKIDNKVVDKSDYLLYPLNSLPYQWIELKRNIFAKGLGNIEVKAKWGYSTEVPKDINFICTVFTAGIVLFAFSAEGEIASERIGAYSVSYKDSEKRADFDRAIDMLKNYQKIIME